MEHAHHWIIEEAGGRRLSPGVCTGCREERLFNNRYNQDLEGNTLSRFSRVNAKRRAAGAGKGGQGPGGSVLERPRAGVGQRG